MLEGLAQLLNDAEVVIWDPDGPVGNCFIHELPDQPDQAVMIAYVGGDGESDLVLPYDEVLIRFVTRGLPDNVASAEVLARGIYSKLHGFHTKALPDGTWVVKSEALGRPDYRGKDDNDRHIFAVVVRIEYESITAQREGL